MVNKDAKNAQNVDQYLDEFSQANLSYQLHQVNSNNIEEKIRESAQKYPFLIVGGGDGTMRTAAHYCAGSKIVLGILPLGTLNHFSKEFNLPQNPKDMIRCIHEFKTTTIDLASVNGKIFVNNSSIGIYPKFAKLRDEYAKKYNKWISYFPSLIEVLKKHDVFESRIKSASLNSHIISPFLMISNNIYCFEFPLTFKRDELTRGLLGLYYVQHGKIGLLRLINILFGKENNFIFKEVGDSLEIDFPKRSTIRVSLDGDWEEMKPPLYYQILPQSLRVLVMS
ncbi:diacylglycerol/lipid kinase family protein [Legionella maceachernii]|uniref:diacylglycerol/lipid kinase family protein n=1 Tax=Legionella maceachernii TaxID=466 RepID=UPI0022770A8F|nr:diacylglycerol kinase family protein [Legionella maceachernii]